MTIAESSGQIRIGNKTVNRIGLGTNRITDINEAHELLKAAVELGVNFIDTAHSYRDGESEKTIGNTLAPFPDNLVVATKGGINGASEEVLRSELEQSLTSLKTDSIYLYQLHRVDPNIPLEETLKVLKSFKDEGKVQHIGLSEVSEEQIELAQSIVPIVSVQNEYNLAKRQYESVLDYCTEKDIVFIPWFPLGGLRGETVQVNEIAAKLAEKYKVLPQQIALAWLLSRSPMILPIPGTLSTDHLKSNLEAGSIKLSSEDMDTLTNA